MNNPLNVNEIAAKRLKTAQKNTVLIVEDDQGTKEIFLTKKIYTIGRAPKRDIRISSPFVSRYHATLIRHQHENGYFYYQIMDGDPMGSNLSANGIMVNGNQVYSYELKHGDKILFGPHVIGIYKNVSSSMARQKPNQDEIDTLILRNKSKPSSPPGRGANPPILGGWGEG